MIWENLPEKDKSRLQDMIMNDAALKEINAVFYDLLDAVDNTIAEKLEDAYIEYGTRAIGLAYEQGLKDAGQK